MAMATPGKYRQTRRQEHQLLRIAQHAPPGGLQAAARQGRDRTAPLRRGWRSRIEWSPARSAPARHWAAHARARWRPAPCRRRAPPSHSRAPERHCRRARVTLAKIGTLATPIARIALTMPGPSTAVSMIASSSAGKAKVKSQRFMMMSSTMPLAEAATRPSATPKTRPMPTAMMPTRIEMRAPASNCETTSRPSESVPSQCAGEGVEQFVGAHRWRPADRASRPATKRRLQMSAATSTAPSANPPMAPRAREEAVVAHAARLRKRGSIAAQAMSTTKFTTMTIATNSITQSSTTRRSRLAID